jgi:large subunit ribosomal protein L21
MYAVIQTGGKQYRVAEGDRIDVERLEGDEVSLRPVMLVDGDTVLATAAQLDGATVTARVVGEARGPKIKGYTYKNKSNEPRESSSACPRRRAPAHPATVVTRTPSVWA